MHFSLMDGTVHKSGAASFAVKAKTGQRRTAGVNKVSTCIAHDMCIFHMLDYDPLTPMPPAKIMAA